MHPMQITWDLLLLAKRNDLGRGGRSPKGLEAANYRRKAEGRGQRAEGKIVNFDTKVSPLCSAIRSKAPAFKYGGK